MKFKNPQVMVRSNLIHRLIAYLIVFPVIINIVAFIELSFVPKEYLNDYFKYIKYVFSIIILYEFMVSIKHFSDYKLWLKFSLALLIFINYFYGGIIFILMLSQDYDKLKE